MSTIIPSRNRNTTIRTFWLAAPFMYLARAFLAFLVNAPIVGVYLNRQSNEILSATPFCYVLKSFVYNLYKSSLGILFRINSWHTLLICDHNIFSYLIKQCFCQIIFVWLCFLCRYLSFYFPINLYFFTKLISKSQN